MKSLSVGMEHQISEQYVDIALKVDIVNVVAMPVIVLKKTILLYSEIIS
jgi:hypothetical protein